MDEKKCDYFNQFIKLAINDLKKNGSCYVFHKYQVEEIKNRVKEELNVMKTDFGYSIRYK